jgi:hypothetical protein
MMPHPHNLEASLEGRGHAGKPEAIVLARRGR